jgi:membrane-associated phospholipid phosphatase
MMWQSFKAVVLQFLGRVTGWMGQHRVLARLIVLSISLGVFLVVIPVYVRLAFWNGILSNTILTSMLLVFSLVSLSLLWSTGQVFDAWAFLFFNLRGSRPIWLDWVMTALTQLGSGPLSLGIAVVFFFTGERLLAYELVLGILSLWLVVEFIKYMVRRSRPFIRLTQARIVGYRPGGRSFPSGHTSQVFFMATLFAQHFHLNIWVVFILYAVALMVGITRMYGGAHYPRDVLAGAILGSAWGLVGVMVDGFILNGIS